MGVNFLLQVLFSNRLKTTGIVVVFLLGGSASLAVEPRPSDYLRSVDRALGINSNFGRWNSQINLVYDPDGAPAMFASNSDVLALLEEAASEWELVSGIQFNVTGADSSVPDDDNLGPNDQDGLVRVFWGAAGGAAGLAGPNGGFYDEDLGYFPYSDGSIELNDDPELWGSQAELVQVLVHEFGHLIGLGHSDNPDSIMFANPYNHLNHPRADDILAARALYGNGSLNIQDVTEPLDQWVYKPPSAAPLSVTGTLFKANSIFDQGSFIATDSEQPLSEVNANTQDNVFLWFYFASGPKSSGDIDIDATIVVVDPFGYVYTERDYQIECEMNFSCASGTTIGETHVLKSVPGEWSLYVIDDDTNTTLHELAFDVNTTVSFNKPPVAEVTVTGISSTRVNITVEVEDPEGDDIDIYWHPQGNLGDQDNDGFLDSEIIDKAASGDTVSRDITFLSANTHTIFIELRDDAPKYDGSNAGSSAAGDGFQGLIAVTVDLPVSSNSDVTIRQNFELSSGAPLVDTGGGGALTGIVLVNAIAEANTLQKVNASDGSQSTAKFGAGASADSGVSTSLVFNGGDEVVIGGSVSPQLGDIGFAGEIYIVLISKAPDLKMTYLDLDGNYYDWDGALTSLQPAFERDDLVLSEGFELYNGVIQSGLYGIFMGYRVTEGNGGPVHFNGKAFRFKAN